MFFTRLLEAIKRLASSKKVITALVGMIVTFAARRNVILSPEDVNTVVMIFVVLIGAQGVTDWGKAAAQVKADNPISEPTQTQVVNVEKK